MQHYELVVLVHPDHSDRVDDMVADMVKTMQDKGGIVHRQENWGRRHLAYPIQKVNRAHYLLFNFDNDASVARALDRQLGLNETVLRHLLVIRDRAVSGQSPLYRAPESLARADAAEATAQQAKDEQGSSDNAEPASTAAGEGAAGSEKPAVAEPSAGEPPADETPAEAATEKDSAG